ERETACGKKEADTDEIGPRVSIDIADCKRARGGGYRNLLRSLECAIAIPGKDEHAREKVIEISRDQVQAAVTVEIVDRDGAGFCLYRRIDTGLEPAIAIAE